MDFFGLGKNKVGDEELSGCGCGKMCNKETIVQAESTKTSDFGIKVLGSGCTKCNQLETATKQALEYLGMNTDIEHVTNFAQIATYGVMTTPALVVDGKVVSYGKVLKKDEVINLLKKARGLI